MDERRLGLTGCVDCRTFVKPLSIQTGNSIGAMATHVTLTLHVRLSPSARAQAMVAASHMPAMVRTALLLRITMGRNARWKTSHNIEMPSTEVDCDTHRGAPSARGMALTNCAIDQTLMKQWAQCLQRKQAWVRVRVD